MSSSNQWVPRSIGCLRGYTVGQFTQDLIAGRIDYMCPTLPLALAPIENRSIKALAVLTRERAPRLPALASAQEQGLVDFDAGVSLTDAERNSIIEALGSRTVRFVPVPAFEQLVPTEGYAVLSLAEPVVVDGQLTITTALWCASLCGTGGAYAVERADATTWLITDPVGPQWEA